MWWYGHGVGPEFIEDILEPPRNTPWNKWACGCVVPGLLAIWAARVIAIQQFWMPMPIRRSRYMLGHRSSWLHPITFGGPEAWWAGIAILCLGVAVHTHFFWNTHERLQEYAEPARNLAILGFVVCVIVPLVSSFRLI